MTTLLDYFDGRLTGDFFDCVVTLADDHSNFAMALDDTPMTTLTTRLNQKTSQCAVSLVPSTTSRNRLRLVSFINDRRNFIGENFDYSSHREN